MKETDLGIKQWQFSILLIEKSWNLIDSIHCQKTTGRSRYSFNAVPTGVEKLSYAEPAFIYFENIPIYNPDTSIHTDWDEQSLRSYWQKTEFPKMKAYMNF